MKKKNNTEMRKPKKQKKKHEKQILRKMNYAYTMNNNTMPLYLGAAVRGAKCFDTRLKAILHLKQNTT